MRKTFIKKMLLFISIAAILTITIVFFMQSWIIRNNAEYNAENIISEIQKKIELNRQDIEEITQSQNAEGLAKARALSLLIQQNPTMIETSASLSQLCRALNIDGLCVSDETGVIRWGTDYVGFDMNSSDQSRPFMQALADLGFELAQQPQLNGAKNQMRQFIGVARIDRPGIVQIELSPQRLEKALERNKIQNLLAGYVFGSNGYMIAVDPANRTVAAHKDNAWIGKSAEEAGLPEEKEGSGFISIDGQEMFYVARDCEDWTIYAVLPKAELYQDRALELGVFFIAILLIFALLVFLIDKMLKQLILSGIDGLQTSLRRITSGELSHKVNVSHTEEFSQLSKGLNQMVQSIQGEMEKAEQKAQETENIMRKQHQLLQSVEAAFQEVKKSSEKMHGISRQLESGSSKQSKEMVTLTSHIDQISAAAQESAAQSVAAASLAEKSEMDIRNNKEAMQRMLTAMNEINQTSEKIGQVIETVNAIADQTNILAINASIEAARAGEAGKGFAVVAQEVSDLASKSADAVKETQTLIENALQKNRSGAQILTELAENFDDVVAAFKNANQMIEYSVQAASGAAMKLEEIMKNVHEVSAVAEETESIAQESSQISSSLLVQAQHIDQIIRVER